MKGIDMGCGRVYTVSNVRDKRTDKGDTMTALDLTPADLAHRTSFRDYVVANAVPGHRETLADLYAAWADYNRDFFDGDLQVPYIVFGTPGSARVLGTCQNITDFGGKLQITLRRSLFDGKHKAIDWSAPAEGIDRYRKDVLLHEMVHQFHFEVTGDTEDSYKGHGPKFAEVCNTIGHDLGLEPVRAAKARGRDKDMKSCAQWPHNVRPADYYMGAVIVEDLAQEAEADQAEADPAGLLSDAEQAALMDAAELYMRDTGSTLAIEALGRLLEALGVGN